ncbi:MAG: glycosyltransferase [Acidimicrobiales bacterium]
MKSISTSIVHERFTEMGGSEKVVAALARLWPRSTLLSPIIDQKILDPALRDLNPVCSPLQRLYRGDGRYSHLLPLLPIAMASLEIPSNTELVVLSHHAFSNRVRIQSDIPTISYVHSPARWMWDPVLRSADAPGPVSNSALSAFAATQRRADRRAAQKPDILIANSTEVAGRISRWWNRPSVVIPPPVDLDTDPILTRTTPREDFFLLAGRLVPYKRADIAIEAATRAGVQLVVAGDGRFRARCEEIAGPTVRFLGSVSDDELHDLYRRCRALLFPGVEDFGIVPVEAMAHGAPVIGVNRGGLLDTVIHGTTGVLLEDSPIREDLVARFATTLIAADLPSDESLIVKHASLFSEESFAERILEQAELVLSGQQRSR